MINFKCTITTRPPTENENNLFGIFISHSNNIVDFELVKKLAAKMKKSGLFPLYDKDFLEGGQDYLLRIQNCLKCYAGVVVVSKNSLNSDWVNYECGYMRSLGIPIYLWDPHNTFMLNKKRADRDLFNTHISQYLPASYDTIGSLIEALKKRSVYSDIFTQECENINTDSFNKMLHDNVSTAMLRIASPELIAKKELFRGCKLGTLVVNFGMFYENQGDGIHCWAQRRKSNGSYTTEGAPLLNDGICEISKSQCAMCLDAEQCKNKGDFVILNHVMYNGYYFDRNEADFNENILLDEGLITFYIPVHKKYGTEFKFIIDAPSYQKHNDLLRLFETLGLNPTASDSLNGWRIYLSLPDMPTEGLFRLTNKYSNNFLCPRAIQEPKNRTIDFDSGWEILV